jgi:ABC-type phosphate/phosphonate transport system permease subunit
MGEEQQMENNNEFWANVSVIAVSPVAIAAGFAKGAYDASTDHGAFSEGFNAAARPIMKAAKDFGAEHGTTMTRGVVTGAAGTLGARIVREAFKHLRI